MEIRLVQPGLLWITARDAPDWTIPIHTAELAALLHVSKATVTRWARGAPVPYLARLAIRAHVLGFLPHRRWSDWRLDHDTGRLYAPNGYPFYPGELAHRELLHTHLDVLRARVAELEAELADAHAAAAWARARWREARQRRALRCERTGRPRALPSLLEKRARD